MYLHLFLASCAHVTRAEHHITFSAEKGTSEVRWILRVAALKKTKTVGRGRWLSGGAHARDEDLVRMPPLPLPVVVPVPNHLCTA